MLTISGRQGDVGIRSRASGGWGGAGGSCAEVNGGCDLSGDEVDQESQHQKAGKRVDDCHFLRF